MPITFPSIAFQSKFSLKAPVVCILLIRILAMCKVTYIMIIVCFKWGSGLLSMEWTGSHMNQIISHSLSYSALLHCQSRSTSIQWVISCCCRWPRKGLGVTMVSTLEPVPLTTLHWLASVMTQWHLKCISMRHIQPWDWTTSPYGWRYTPLYRHCSAFVGIGKAVYNIVCFIFSILKTGRKISQ